MANRDSQEANFQDLQNVNEDLSNLYLSPNNDSTEYLYDKGNELNVISNQQMQQTTEFNETPKNSKKNSKIVKVSEINSINLTTKFSRTTAETFELLNVVNTQKESRVSLIQIKPENFVNLKKILDSDKKKGESKNAHTIENIEEPKKVSPIQIDFHPEDIELIPKNLQNKVTSSNQKGKEKKEHYKISLRRFKKLLEEKTQKSMANLFKDRPNIKDEKFYEILDFYELGHLREEIKIALAEARSKYKKKIIFLKKNY